MRRQLGKRNGLFVAFEGLEGVGKTTLVQECAIRLKRDGIEAVAVPEFSDSLLGAYLKKRLSIDPFLKEPGCCTALTQAFSVLADTAHAVEYTIDPLLRRQTVVLKDRYRESIVACQHVCLVDEYGWTTEEAVARLITIARLIPLDPDITLYLYANPSLTMQRLSTREEISARDALEHVRKVMQREHVPPLVEI